MGQTPTTSTGGGGLEPNIAALLAYLFGITAILWLVMEPYNKDRFTRFHSFQALFLWIALIVIYTVLGITVIGVILYPIVFLAQLAAVIYCGYRAYKKETFKLPLIGNLAEKQAGA